MLKFTHSTDGTKHAVESIIEDFDSIKISL
jgi:hypothetical protein